MCKAERRGPDDRCRRKSVASVVVDEITTPSRPASSDYSSLVERNGNRVQIALVFERKREREKEIELEREEGHIEPLATTTLGRFLSLFRSRAQREKNVK